MKRVASVVVSLCLIGGVLLANLETASSQAPPQGRTLTLFDPQATDFEKNINEGRRGFSSGDWSVVKDSFFDPDTCEKVGTFLGRFTFIKSAGRNDGFFVMDGGAVLSDGKITFYWPGRFTEFGQADAPPTDGGAITGGTGAYEGVGGSMLVQEDQQLCEKKGALITLELDR
jgi:hypothetical protein